MNRLFWVAAALCVHAPGFLAAPISPQRVLVIQSADDDILVYRRASQRLEHVLTGNSSVQIEFFHEYLQDFKLVTDSVQLAESVQKKYFLNGRPDLIVATGTSALRLCVKYGLSHFRATPVVSLLADDHVLSIEHMPPQITGVSFQFDFRGTVRMALSLHPNTKRIFFVAGSSGPERYYKGLFKKEAADLLANYNVTYLDDLTLGELLNRLAQLPQQSVVFYLTMLRDSSSTYYIPFRIVRSITAASSAPIYNAVITEIGNGVVGGSYFDVDGDAEQAASMAKRILSGEPAQNIRIQKGTFRTAVDWRQLKRWHIEERNLPAGTVVLFREQTPWMRFRQIIIWSLLIFAVQLLLILRLIREGRRRKRSESALSTLSGHLLNAQEEERAHLARELHDGVSQKIALLGISLSFVNARLPSDEIGLHADVVRLLGVVKELANEIRQLSHGLHPSALKSFGIRQALEQYCEEFGVSHKIDIQVTIDIGSYRPCRKSELCLYRIAQEALRNVAKHAHAKRAALLLVRDGTYYTLKITDDGCGFDPGDPRGRGLGLLSMQERIEAFQGTLTIWSKANQGTVIAAKLPLDSRAFRKQRASAYSTVDTV